MRYELPYKPVMTEPKAVVAAVLQWRWNFAPDESRLAADDIMAALWDLKNRQAAR